MHRGVTIRATHDIHAAPIREQRFVGRLVGAMLLLAVVGAGVWHERAPLLRGAAYLWIVSDPVTRSDAVAVLGGGLDMRPFIAAELYQRGLVNKVLISQVGETRSSQIGAVPAHSELNRNILLKLGVPEGAIGTFGKQNRNTRDEAMALRDWADQHGVTGIIVPTEIFAARRVRWIFNREFAGSSVHVEIPSYEPSEYTGAAWWRTEAGMIAFQNEIMKYLYYRAKY
jgi:uncharacterized SAM-binding protein YcdF (DUF218 family)